MGRSPCCAKEGLNRGAWSASEDMMLTNYITDHGEGRWRDLPQRAGLKRCGKSCRLRWLNYLRPDIKRGNISEEEEQLIIRLHRLLGNKWSLIAGRLPGRTDNEIKNHWNTKLSKKFHHTRKLEGPTKQVKIKKTEQHIVIRTRATRCSRNVINPQQINNHMVDENTRVWEAQYTSISPYLIDDGNYPSNLLMDFDIGDLMISEILISDSQYMDKEAEQKEDSIVINRDPDNGTAELTYSDEARSEAMVENWGDMDHVLQSNKDLELNALASFLNSENFIEIDKDDDKKQN